MIQDTLKDDLKLAMKKKDEDKKNALRVIMGELARSDKKQFSDDEVIAIIKKLIKSEKEMLDRSGQAAPSPFMQILENYLPQMATASEIRTWIAANIDFSQYKNKMQAMGAIMSHFGAGADGNEVKKVLQAFSD